MPPTPTGKPSANLHSSHTAALERLLGMIVTAMSAQELDRALWEARSRYSGSMLEQLERAAAQRAHFLLAAFDDA